jgi:succinate dehydrogenase/fumarate reductase flavoprotein subunit
MIDVLVIGGGNAALCAALTAREAGVRSARITNLAGLGQGMGTVIVG